MTAPKTAFVVETGRYSPFSDVVSERTTIGRVSSVDVLRGIVVILMAIDHVRVYSGVPAGGPDPGVFFTRWITNFVAPVFVFLAGTGAYFYGVKAGDKRDVARFLVTRGLLLVLLELTVIRVSWTFNFDYGTYLLAGVIWVIGWCMVALAALSFLPTKAVGGFGLAVILLHNLLPAVGSEHWAVKLLYSGGGVQLGTNGPTLAVLYVLIPWVGVMAAGYAFGTLYEMEPARRRTLLLRIGGGAVLLFVALRFADVYGDGHRWRNANGQGAWPATREFLNTSKYPASLLFLLMTLGPAILLLPVLERARNKATRILEVFGRVPMFYYLLHIPLIHVLACGVSLLRTGSVSPWLLANHPLWPPEQPDGYQWSLAFLYMVWVVAIALLYPACRWYSRMKFERPKWWMKYI